MGIYGDTPPSLRDLAFSSFRHRKRQKLLSPGKMVKDLVLVVIAHSLSRSSVSEVETGFCFKRPAPDETWCRGNAHLCHVCYFCNGKIESWHLKKIKQSWVQCLSDDFILVTGDFRDRTSTPLLRVCIQGAGLPWQLLEEGASHGLVSVPMNGDGLFATELGLANVPREEIKLNAARRGSTIEPYAIGPFTIDHNTT